MTKIPSSMAPPLGWFANYLDAGHPWVRLWPSRSERHPTSLYQSSCLCI